jgi:hypothetical protein
MLSRFSGANIFFSIRATTFRAVMKCAAIIETAPDLVKPLCQYLPGWKTVRQFISAFHCQLCLLSFPRRIIPHTNNQQQIIRKEKTMQKFSVKIARLVVFAFCAALLMANAEAQTRKKSATKKSAAPSALRIPTGTEMKIRLETTIDTKESKDGDRFTATVLSPSKYADATIEGHIAKIDKSGKVTGKTELALAFDRIRLTNGQSATMAAQVVKVYGEDSAKEVDEEGNVKSGSQGKTTAVRSGGGAALGAIIGGIAGGGKGAAIGAAAGAGVGAGSVLIQGSKKVKLESGTEILIKTTR